MFKTPKHYKIEVEILEGISLVAANHSLETLLKVKVRQGIHQPLWFGWAVQWMNVTQDWPWQYWLTNWLVFGILKLGCLQNDFECLQTAAWLLLVLACGVECCLSFWVEFLMSICWRRCPWGNKTSVGCASAHFHRFITEFARLATIQTLSFMPQCAKKTMPLLEEGVVPQNSREAVESSGVYPSFLESPIISQFSW